MNKFFNFLNKHAKVVILIVIIITAFFLYEALSININADYGAFMPWGEASDSYIGGKGGQLPILSKEVSETLSENIVIDTTVPISKSVIASTTTHFPKIIEQTEPDYNRDSDLLVFIESDNLYDTEFLNTLNYCVDALSNTREVSESYSVFDFITLEKNGTRLQTVPFNVAANPYDWTEKEAETLKRRIDNDPVINSYLVSEDSKAILYTFQISYVTAEKLAELSAILDPIRDLGAKVYLNGGEVINLKVFEYLQKDLYTLVLLCFLVIILVYYLSFKSKRSVLIPFSLSAIGLVWTFGTMALLDIDITILNIVTPCMVLTLGSAYAIHVLSEYYAHIQKGENTSPVLATKNVLKTVILACLTTVFGFLSLCISQTEGLKDFGISVAIGITYCAILACTYLPAILTIIPIPTDKKIKKLNAGLLEKFVNKIPKFVVKYYLVLILILVLIFYGFIYVKDKISLDSNYMSYFPASDPFGQESRYIAQKMGGTGPFTVSITAPNNEKNFFLDIDNLTKVYNYEEKIQESPDILQVISFPSYVSFANKTYSGEEGIPTTKGLINLLSRLLIVMENQAGSSIDMILNDDASSMSMIIQHYDSVEENLMSTSSTTRVYKLLVSNLGMLPDGTSVSVNGTPIVNIKFANRLLADQNKSTILSILVVLLLTIITFKSFKYGILTLLPVITGVMINYLFMYLANIPFDIITISFTSIAIGCGVDDSLHFMIRFKRKLNNGMLTEEAISDTLVETGRPIILTSLSIICGMLVLSFASYTPIRYFGLLMSVSLFGSTIASLVFLPPIIIGINKLKLKFKKK